MGYSSTNLFTTKKKQQKSKMVVAEVSGEKIHFIEHKSMPFFNHLKSIQNSHALHFIIDRAGRCFVGFKGRVTLSHVLERQNQTKSPSQTVRDGKMVQKLNNKRVDLKFHERGRK